MELCRHNVHINVDIMKLLSRNKYGYICRQSVMYKANEGGSHTPVNPYRSMGHLMWHLPLLVH